jgi:hypothetical protein
MNTATKNIKKISSQEKHARDNFSGVENIGDEISKILSNYQSYDDKFEKIKKSLETKYGASNVSDKDILPELMAYCRDEEKKLNILFASLNIKLQSAVSHAISGGETKTLKDIIQFMDKYGINDKCFGNNLRNLHKSGNIRDNGFLHLVCIIAAKHNDLDFIKEIFNFSEKNKNRENLFRNMGYEYSQYGEMNTSSLTRLGDVQRIALEALTNGSKDVYDYITSGEGINKDYILQFIDGKDVWIDKINSTQVKNVIKLEPTLIKLILTYIPETLPENIRNIFFISDII